MDDWCKTCGRTKYNHGAATHEFVSTLKGIFPEAEKKEEDMSIYDSVSEVAKKLEMTIDTDGFVDINIDMETAEKQFSVGQNIVRMAITQLEQKGYKSQAVKVQQIGTDNFVNLTVLAGPNFKYRDVFNMVNETDVQVEVPDNASVSDVRREMYAVRFTKRQELTYKIYELMGQGMSKRAIADTMGVSESTVRSILAESAPNVSLEREISEVLNKHSAENGSNTPDFILAEYLMGCLNAFNLASNRRKEFHAGGVIDD